MRITDLLDKRSIYLGAKVSSKEETLDRAVALMAGAERSQMLTHTARVCMQENRKEQPELEKESRFRIVSRQP